MADAGDDNEWDDEGDITPYTVTWEFEVDGANARDAALQALQEMRRQSTSLDRHDHPCFTVEGPDGEERVDLAFAPDTIPGID